MFEAGFAAFLLEVTPHLWGYAFALVGGRIFVGLVVNHLWKAVGWSGEQSSDDEIRPDAWIPSITGLVERTLYVAALQLGQGEFIGFWLAIKVAGQWKRWSDEPSRTRYQIFLIGSGLSILFAVVGEKAIDWAQQADLLAAIGVPIVLVVATTSLLLITRYLMR